MGNAANYADLVARLSVASRRRPAEILTEAEVLALIRACSSTAPGSLGSISDPGIS